MNLNDVAKIIQEYLADSPLVVLGSGASVPYGLPTMGGLADVLRKDALLQAEENSGKLFSDMKSKGLEAAIDNNMLSEGAKNRIRTLTWECINEKDLELFKVKNLEDRMQSFMDSIGIDNNMLSDDAKNRIRTLTWECINEKYLEFLKDKNLEDKMQPFMDLIGIDNNTLSDDAKNRIRTLTWECINEKYLEFFKYKNLEDRMQSLIKLIKKIISTSSNQLTIVTTNYDRLSEYAADLYGASTVTGFEGNFIRRFDGFSEHVNNKRIAARERVVKILKVHGSLDWFKTENEDIVSFSLQEQIPSGCTPLIVPPGKEKYSTTHEEPYRTIIEEADKEFKKAGSFLCIGYGFNDSHIQPKLISQIKNAGKPIVVITKKATDECMRLVADSNVKKYLILEDNGSETRVVSNNGEAIVSGNVWSLNEFMEVW